MNRRTVGVAFVAVVAVAAIGFGAATLTSTTDAGGGGGDDAGPIFDSGNRTPSGSNVTVRGENGSGATDTGGSVDCPAFLKSPLFAYGLLVLAVGGALALRRYYGTGNAVFLLLTVVLPAGIVLGAIIVTCKGITTGTYIAPGANVSRPIEAASEGITSTASPSPLVLGVVALAVVVLGVVLIRQTRGDAVETVETEDDGDEHESLEAVGDAAGTAADRIQGQAGVDNEVYRAWREMAGSLDADSPETSTPGEFAETAAAAGMDPDDVSELTRLFEEVRYGDAPPTEDREERAVAILRRIEATYGESTTEAAADDGPGGDR